MALFAIEVALLAFFVLVWFVDIDLKPRVRVLLRDFSGPGAGDVRVAVLKALSRTCRIVRDDPDVVTCGSIEIPDVVTIAFVDSTGRALCETRVPTVRRRLDRVAVRTVTEALASAAGALERFRHLASSRPASCGTLQGSYCILQDTNRRSECRVREGSSLE